MSRKIFINYRRLDSLGSTGRLYDRLVEDFGYHNVFMDVDTIQPGVNFEIEITKAISLSDVFIVVIGPNWLTVKDKEGNQKLSQANDYVRKEIAFALEMEKTVFPVLVEGAQMPKAEELPQNIKSLSSINAIEIRHSRFNIDTQKLLVTVSTSLNQAKFKKDTVANRNRLSFIKRAKHLFIDKKTRLWGMILVFILTLIAVLYWGINSIMSTGTWFLPNLNGVSEATPTKQTHDTTIVPETKTPEISQTSIPANDVTSTPRFNATKEVSLSQTVTGSVNEISTPTVLPTSKAITVSPSDGMKMVYIPAGDFLMGASGDGENDEQPQHTVFLDPYWIDQLEVTNEMYSKCVDEKECDPPSSDSSSGNDEYYSNPTYANYPVIYVSKQDARNYCWWAGKQLPSEAQWEKAARGSTDNRKYPWGNETINDTYANYGGIIGDTTSVGSYPMGESPDGVLDMIGNVWEWVSDCYGAGYYKKYLPDNWPSNPEGPNCVGWRYNYEESEYEYPDFYHVIRGGSWDTASSDIRITNRQAVGPYNFQGSIYYVSSDIGFRCVLTDTE